MIFFSHPLPLYPIVAEELTVYRRIVIINAMNTAIGGMNAQMARVNSSAEKIAKAGLDLQSPEATAAAADIDLPSEMVNMMHAEHMFKANLSVIKVADNMSNALIDIFV